MKRFLAIAIVASLGLFAGSAMGAEDTINAGTGKKSINATSGSSVGSGPTYAVGDAASGIGDSRHNLGAFGEHVTAGVGDGTIAYVDGGKLLGSTEICVFCHTPHHATPATKPLWNRSTSASSSYTAYGTTIAGTSNTTLTNGSVSLACLSCHDGITAFDALVNAPGKNSGSAGMNSYLGVNEDTGLGWTFTEKPKRIDITSRLGIGPALANDHPINIEYNDGNATGGAAAKAASLRDRSTRIASINLSADFGQFGTSDSQYFDDITSNIWSVKGFLSSTATISDLLRSDGSSGNFGPNQAVTAATAKVECGSCHDPHFKNQSAEEVFYSYGTSGTWDVEVDGLFLRRVGGNTGSGVCRTCHNK